MTVHLPTSSTRGRLRRAGAILAPVLAVGLSGATALAASSPGRPASRSEHAALVAAFASQDGNASEIRNVQISRSNSALAVVCVHTPEGGPEAAVFHRVGRKWRLSSSGRPGTSGSSTERRLEHVCG